MTLLILSLWWLAGVGVAALGLSGVLQAAIAAIGAGGSVVLRPGRSILLVTLMGLALFGLGGWRYQQALPTDQPQGIAVYNDLASVRFRAVVNGEPEERGNLLRVRLRAREVQKGEEWFSTTGGVLMWAGAGTSLRYGDLLELTGKLEAPPTFDEFNYRDYLARRGITSVIYRPTLEHKGEGYGSPWREALLDVRGQLASALARALPEPQASLAQAILLGKRTALPQDLNDDLNATGTSHIVAVSGYNVTLVAGLMLAALAWLVGRRPAAALSALAVVGYAFLTGMEPPVQRAMVMDLLYLVATVAGRQNSTHVSLAAAAAAMTAWQPPLVDDVSFQLSFAATAGLVLLVPQLTAATRAVLPGGQAPGGVRDGLISVLAVTMAAIIFALPLIAANFGRLSLVSPLANLLAVPLFPATMVTSGIVAVVGTVGEPLARPLGWLAWLPLTLMVESVRLTARLPFASVSMGDFGAGHVAAYYGLLAGLLAWISNRPAWRPLAWPRTVSRSAVTLAGAVVLTTASLTVWLILLWPGGGHLTLTVLDVGQGDALLITGPKGHHILVDGGPNGQAITNALGRNLPFWDRGIDLVVLTHPQEDHLTGLISVIERYDVRAVADGLERTGEAFRAWQEVTTRKAIPRYQVQPSQWWDLGEGAALEVLSPPPGCNRSVNDCSLVLRLRWNDVAFLLTGDIEAEAEEELLYRRIPLRSAVLKVAHHGSATSTTPGFVAAVRPLLSIISVGQDNPFGHPSPQTLERLASSLILRTDRHGDVTIETDGKKLWLKTQRDLHDTIR